MAIASVQQAAFGDHNIQYQFRTENNGGQVRRPRAGSPEGQRRAERREGGRARRRGRERLRPGPSPAPASLSSLCRPLQVTYRVVQVTDGQLDGQGDAAGAVSVVSTAAFAGGQQAVTQVGVDGAAQRPGPAAASVPPGPAAPFPLVGGPQRLGRGRGGGSPRGWGMSPANGVRWPGEPWKVDVLKHRHWTGRVRLFLYIYIKREKLLRDKK